MHNTGMIYGYARPSIDGQRVGHAGNRLVWGRGFEPRPVRFRLTMAGSPCFVVAWYQRTRARPTPARASPCTLNVMLASMLNLHLLMVGRAWYADHATPTAVATQPSFLRWVTNGRPLEVFAELNARCRWGEARRKQGLTVAFLAKADIAHRSSRKG